MYLIRLTFFILGLAISQSAVAQHKNEQDVPCVQYYVVGLSECDPQEEISPTIAIKQPSPTIVVASPKAEISPLDQKIDEFIENYGKPPREFVAFHLEPTLENALTWVRTYNTLLQRNLDITDAWTQAENIYLDNVKQGIDITANLPAFAEGSGLPPVPDFGSPIDRFKPAVAELEFLKKSEKTNQNRSIGAFAEINLTQNLNPLALTQAEVSNQLSPPFNPLIGLETPQIPTLQGNVNTLQAQPNISGKIEIDYFFSAQCPYCAKFEPEFQQFISEYKDKISVTCVDVSSHTRQATNILGKVDCTWRPAQPGEAKELGLKATPSLIIRRGAGQPLERVSGYVPIERVRAHLFGSL